MRRAAPTALLIAFIMAMSVALAGGASTFARAGRGSSELKADLASRIRADYSADPTGTTLAPLDEGILKSARQDEDLLDKPSDGVEIVQVFNPGGLPPADVEVPGADPTVGASPTPGGTPGSGETPAPGETPGSDATPTPRPEPGVTPTPGLTPTPALTPTPTPTPIALLSSPLYLHNNPTPPVGDTSSQENLTMSAVGPVSPILYNYDADRDSSPGLTISKGGVGPQENDPAKHQHWRSAALPIDMPIKGELVVELWSALKDFNPGRGTVSVYIYDYAGSYTFIAATSMDLPDWQNGNSDWQLQKFTMPDISYTLPAGHSLDLIVIVRSSSADDIWFAYDTNARKSRVRLVTP